MKMKRVIKIIFPVLTILCMIFILTNSMQNFRDAEKKQGAVAGIIENVAQSISKKEVNLTKADNTTISKIAHVIEFSMFSLFLSLSLLLSEKVKGDTYQKVLLCGIFLAITDEHLQLLFVGRGSKLTDVLIDLAGIMIGYGIAKLIAKFARRKKGGKNSSAS